MPSDPLIGRVLAGRFEVKERIGEGGYSVIYRANQVGVDRDVALKVLAAHVASDPAWVERFRRAARALARVDHPNVTQVYDFGQTEDGLHFIAMEHLPGRTLRRELHTLGHLPARRALDVIAQAARGLGAVHAHGIVHRDFKPESMLLCELPAAPALVKILFSTVVKTSTPEAPHTPAGKVFGTPWYMAPEQVRGQALGPPADLYAAGVVLYEALAGTRPFDAQSPIEVAVMHLRDPPPPLDHLPGIVTAILQRALAKDVTARYRSGEELARDCELAASVIEDC